LNIDEALRYFAVNTALSNLDSYQGNMKHNYYLYEIDGVFQILPWDFNLAFGGFGGGNISIDNPTNGNLEDRPLLNILLSNEEYKEKYYEYLEQVAAIFTDGTLKSMIEEVSNLIEPYVIKDPTKFCTIEQFYEATDTTGTYTNTTKQTEQPSALNENMQMPEDIKKDKPPENMEQSPQDIENGMQMPNNGFNRQSFGRGGMGNTGNLLETAQKLAQNILNQLSGETVVTSSSMDRPMQMNFDENNKHKRRENFEFNGANRPSPPNGDGFNQKQNPEQNINYTQSVIIVLVSLITISLALILVFKFRKKRFS